MTHLSFLCVLETTLKLPKKITTNLPQEVRHKIIMTSISISYLMRIFNQAKLYCSLPWFILYKKLFVSFMLHPTEKFIMILLLVYSFSRFPCYSMDFPTKLMFLLLCADWFFGEFSYFVIDRIVFLRKFSTLGISSSNWWVCYWGVSN